MALFQSVGSSSKTGQNGRLTPESLVLLVTLFLFVVVYVRLVLDPTLGKTKKLISAVVNGCAAALAPYYVLSLHSLVRAGRHALHRSETSSWGRREIYVVDVEKRGFNFPETSIAAWRDGKAYVTQQVGKPLRLPFPGHYSSCCAEP
jgi:hypothetical protein